MFSALLYLQYHSVRNHLRSRLRRLKNPKYLIGAIFGLLYFGFSFGAMTFGAVLQHMGKGPAVATPASLLGEDFGALLLCLIVLIGWILPNERAALAFSEAEVAFLFPAPITRRGLIHYQLIRSQVRIFFSIFFLTLVTGRWLYFHQVWIIVLGWWIILSTLRLHFLASSFARSMLFDRGITNWRRRGIILILILAALGLVLAGGWPSLPAWGDDPRENFLQLYHWAKQMMTTGAAPYILYPFRLVVRPYLATDASSFFLALGPALALMAAHYYLVMHANVAFEEASVGYSKKIAERIATMRAQQIPGLGKSAKAKRPPFRLAPTGPPALALMWKNLILAGNFFTGRMFFALLWVVGWMGVMGVVMEQHSSGLAMVGAFAFMLLFASIFMGPQWLRCDFRADLAVMDLLRVYPVPGWQIVLGEVLAPVAILAAVQWLLILVAAFSFLPTAEGLPLGLRIGGALAAAVLLPAIDFMSIIIPNASALVMPGWVRLNKDGPRGIETFGQVFVLMIAQMLILFLSLIPAGIIFALVFFLGRLVLSDSLALPLAAFLAAAVLIAEGIVAIRLLGKVFERFDLSAEQTT